MKPNWCVCQVSSDSGYVSYRIPAGGGSHAVSLAAVAHEVDLHAAGGPRGCLLWGRSPATPEGLHSRRGAAGKAGERSFLCSSAFAAAPQLCLRSSGIRVSQEHSP